MSTLKIPSRFDAAAAQWDQNPTRVELARAIGAGIVWTVPVQPTWRALDYGAGTGLLTLCLQPQVASILAMDASPGMLDALARKLLGEGLANVQIRQWDLESEPCQETGFDLVISSMTLHHLRQVPLVLQRLAAVLKPGGWLAVADLDTEDGSFHGESNDVFHHGFAREQITGWLREAGFTEVGIRDVHTIAKPDAAGRPRSYGVFLAVGQKGPA